VVDGTVPVGGVSGYGEARAQLDGLAPAQVRKRAALAYRRYCHHCHGSNGDGRIIVGESFGSELPDLRSEEIQQQDDQDLYNTVMDGGGNMLSLRGTLTPLEALQTVRHLRTLAGAPSRPFYPPKDTVPLR
jgi:mono/diheme cytochrome c family protein